MVVVLIIAILIAIAIPTFLGARTRAQNRAAQSSLRNALTAAKTSFTDNSDYSGATAGTCAAAAPAGGLCRIEPSLTFLAGPSTGFKVVSVVALPGAGATKWWATVKSKSGTCFGIEDNSGNGGGTTYAGTTTAVASATCDGSGADPGFPDASW
jgi:type IV pilus assembly protein PilA